MTTRYNTGLMAAAVLALSSQPLPARASVEEFGQLNLRREHMKWPSPESVVRELQSQNADVRFKALLSVGVPEKLARRPIYNSATPATVIGSEVVKAEQIEVRYAALGSDETRQAIVVAQVGGSYAYATVATPKPNGWERIAIFDCWCKYDAETVVDTFVSLNLAPDPLRGNEIPRYELVLRASGGGTGIYDQNEVHFRLYRGEMKAVISFVSRISTTSYGGPEPPRLRVERRWFYPSLPVSLSDGRSKYVAVLVESRSKAVVPPSTVYFLIRELQDLYLNGITCRTFQWNQKLFQYDPVSAPNACKPPEK
jgi:hypothetical protein